MDGPSGTCRPESCDGCKKTFAKTCCAQVKPSADDGIWAAGKQEGIASLEVGRAPAQTQSQLLDHHRKARQDSAHHGGLGIVARWSFPVQHGEAVAQGAES